MQETEGDNKRAESWRAMEEIQSSGKAQSIGVSNYEVEHFEEMEEYANMIASGKSNRATSFLSAARRTADYCDEHGIIVTNYSPLVRGRRTSEPIVEQIANNHNKTNCQIYIRWGLQHGNVVIPKSAQRTHIIENADVFDFVLSESEMSALDGLEEGFSII
jgi:diketogulonate reductase-like aldo/keto reductase